MPLAVVASAIKAGIDGDRDVSPGSVTPAERNELTALSHAGGYAPLWIDAAGRPGRSARDALALLAGASADGLNPMDYRSAALGALASTLDAAEPPSTRDVARFELGLSLHTLRFFRHLHIGRVDPRSIGFRMTAPADTHDFAAQLHSAIADGRVTESANDLTPPLALYRSLRDMLARYRQLAGDPTLEALTVPDTTVRPGEPYPGVDALRRRLAAFGDLPTDTPGPSRAAYEGALVDAVARFQVRHGLESDGIIGKRTRAALEVPLSVRVRQIELALERLRWLPHLAGDRFVAVNIPMFRLWAWDAVPSSGAPSFAMDVVVGRALDTRTPVFVEEMRYVIFRPYWNVPPGILRRDILPAIERDPEYLRQHDMEIVRGLGDDAPPVLPTADNLSLLRSGLLRVRQRPGPTNAMGLVKFIFPNDENVYIHDTPAQEWFGRARRDFSGGCVRVEDPVALAQWVLGDQPGWTRDRILSAMNGSGPHRVNLARPIQVILFYVTAVVMPEDGTIRFAEDIYGHDTRLDRALALLRQAS